MLTCYAKGARYSLIEYFIVIIIPQNSQFVNILLIFYQILLLFVNACGRMVKKEYRGIRYALPSMSARM